MTDLKIHHQHLKVTLAIGGWNEGSEKFSTMTESVTSREVFVDSVVAFLKKHKFDGLDIDWEYPGVCRKAYNTPSFQVLTVKQGFFS